jgi:hypothetical protein
MPLSKADMDRKIDEHFHHEATDNVEGVLATLAPDAVHDIVGWPPGPCRGREAARRFYEQTFNDLAESRVTVIHRLYGDRFLIDESMWDGRGFRTAKVLNAMAIGAHTRAPGPSFPSIQC